MRGRKALTALALEMAMGCGGAAADRQPEPTPQFEKVLIRSVNAPFVFVLVVDDRGDSESLRRAIGEAFARVATRQLEFPRACEPPYDPGRWDPVDWSVVVVRPNAPQGVRYVTPADNPDLAWKTNFGTAREPHARFVAAVRSTLEPSSTDPTARVRVLEAFADIQRLVQGLSPPLILEGEQVLSLLDANTLTMTLVASAADDQSPLAPADYAVKTRGQHYVYDVIAPRRTPGDTTYCSIDATETTERFGEWFEHGDYYVNTLEAWPCAGLTIFDIGTGDCKPSCVDRMPELDAAGSAACRVLVEVPASEECPEQRGWVETASEPVAARELGWNDPMRVCEVRQLEGESLRSCQTDFSCAACGPGWCWTTVPELAHRCEAGVPYAFRFPRGADFGPFGVWRIVCGSRKTE